MQPSSMITYDIPMEQIYSDEDFNCRGKIAPIDVVDLARSIKEHGLQQPITVQPYTRSDDSKIKYRIVSGHRRHKAYLVNAEKTIPAFIRAELTEIQARLLNLDENLKRKDLNILQEAKAIQHFRVAGMNENDISRETGMSRGWVQVRLMALSFDEPIQNEIVAGFLNQEHIRELYKRPKEERYAAVKIIKEAKIRGDKRPVKLKQNPIKPFAKKIRGREEIFEMQDEIRRAVGNGLATRALAWAAGEISTYDLYQSIKEEVDEKGIDWTIPDEITKSLMTSGFSENYK